MKVWKVIVTVAAVLVAVAGIVFAVYHWELDKKLIAWVKKNCKCCCSKAGEAPEEIPEIAAEPTA